jgi:phage terminase large subunit-like protein
MTDEQVMDLRNEHEQRGQLDMFYREYRNIPVSTEDATFRPEYFHYYDEPELADNKDIETVIMIDPAKTVKLHSAQSAIVGVGIDRASAKLYVRDIVAEKLYPDELYDEAFKMAARLGANVVGIEVTSLNEFITQPIKNEMSKRGQYFELIELKARGKKEDRIAALVPFYRQGYVFHNKTCCGGLEGQLLSFPRSRLWDIMDALAYIVEMMELGERYFEPPEMDDPEEEFKELDYDEAVNDWRYV